MAHLVGPLHGLATAFGRAGEAVSERAALGLVIITGTTTTTTLSGAGMD